MSARQAIMRGETCFQVHAGVVILLQLRLQPTTRDSRAVHFCQQPHRQRRPVPPDRTGEQKLSSRLPVRGCHAVPGPRHLQDLRVSSFTPATHPVHTQPRPNRRHYAAGSPRTTVTRTCSRPLEIDFGNLNAFIHRAFSRVHPLTSQRRNCIQCVSGDPTHNGNSNGLTAFRD